MKLQARNFVVRKPETIDITMFFKKFCIATRTKKKKAPMGVFFFLVPRRAESLCKGLVCALMKRERKP